MPLGGGKNDASRMLQRGTLFLDHVAPAPDERGLQARSVPKTGATFRGVRVWRTMTPSRSGAPEVKMSVRAIVICIEFVP